jgi:hypothetical protein
MRTSAVCSGLLALAASTALFASAADAQVCVGVNDTFWKNDILADAPQGFPAGALVLVAVCNDDAVGSYFQVPPGSPPQHIKQVSMGFGHVLDDPSFGAIMNIEIYEGDVGFNPGGNITMGNKVFDLQADTGTTWSVFSTGMRTKNIAQHNVVVEGNFVVAFRMLLNVSFPGCPDASIGSAANVLTDNTGCNPGINVLDERNVGWVDPADWQFQLGQTICPTWFRGNWLIRACSVDAGSWTDLGNGLAGTNGLPNIVGSGPLTEGSTNPITLSNALPLVDTWLIFGFTAVNAPFKGGVFVPTPDLLLGPVPADATGGWTLGSPWPAGVPTGFETWWQVWFSDTGAVKNFAASNALLATTP